MNKFDKIEYAMKMLQEDTGTPRSVREKLNHMIHYLKQNVDDATKVSTILSELEELCSDVNIPAFVRTQMYAISGMLEQIQVE